MPKAKGNYCNVEGCHNRSEQDGGNERHYYRLPAIITNQGSDCEILSSERRRLWLASLNQDFSGKNMSNVRVCSDHFVNGKKASLYQKDSPDWVPTKHMSSQTRTEPDVLSPSVNNRYERKVKRHKRTVAAAALMELSFTGSSEADLELPDEEPETGIASQTDTDQPLYMAMEEELQTLRTENIELRTKVNSMVDANTHNIDFFTGDDDKVKYYTGLPTFSILLALFNHVEKCLPKKQSLPKFQFVMLCLMRLRLNLPLQFLAYEFAVSASTASRYFTEAINVLFEKLGPVLQWPEREMLRKTMPMQFLQSFGNKVAVIIDCFEIFTEQPSNLLTKTKMWSQYKQNHTAKYLIGISPQGKIIYISKGWG